ncbi:MAG: hypothetical protein ACT4TC_02930 [Myxococcaceae bacterium]
MRSLLRVFLAAALIYGVSPSSKEAVELIVQFGLTGHLNLFDPVEADVDCPEHACSDVSHKCGCCVSQAVVVPSDNAGEVVPPPDASILIAEGLRPSPLEPGRHFRPPIAG